jgi:hypothetical protein
MRRGYRLLLAVASGVPVAAIPAQQRTVHDAMIWGAIFGDHRIAKQTALYWDYHPRRADAGETWQINLGAVGITRDLSPQWRVTTALGWSIGYRYGEFAARSSTAELRPWIQLAGTRRVGTFTWSDRTRAEFRMLHPVGDLAPPDADWNPTVVRLRRLDRVQHRLTADNRWYASASQEWLVNVSPAAARIGTIEQSRTQLLIGRQLSKFVRGETGYGLQRFTRRGGHEMNHTWLLYMRLNAPLR